MRGFDQILRDILLFAPPFILSLSFHEFAHAWTAYKLGDSTAKFLGRMTVDPMAHLSWLGTVIFPIISIATGGIFFGWANPVPVDMRNFKRPRQHMAIVALAGPASNILLAFVSAGLFAFLFKSNPFNWIGSAPNLATPVQDMLSIAIQLNLVLAIFNLIPLPPLDGSRIVQGLVPHRTAERIDAFAPQAQVLLIILIFTGGFRLLIPVVEGGMHILSRIYGI